MNRFWAGIAAVAILTGSAASAAEGDTKAVALAARFGAREQVQQASLSPDGRFVAFVQPLAGPGSAVFVAEIEGADVLRPVPILSADGKPERISSCQWASISRLLCDIYAINDLPTGGLAYVSRTLAIDMDGKNMKVLENKAGTGRALNFSLYGGQVIDLAPGEDGHVLMLRQYIPEETVGTRNAQTKEGFGVDDVDSITLRASPMEQPRKDAREFITDGKGHVRIMGLRSTTMDGYDKEQQRYFYRPLAGGGWKPLSVTDTADRSFHPVRVDTNRDIAYGLMDKDGRAAAYSKALDGSGTETLLFAHPQVDVDDFVTIGRNRRTIGASYVTDKREVTYFDADMAKLAKALSRALPNAPLVRIIDASQDEKKLLIWAGSDVDPGCYYLLDRTNNHMKVLMADRPQLDGLPLAPVKAVSYPAVDGVMIPAYLTMPVGGATKGLPAIVMPHGGPGARDEWGFDWLSQYYASLGYAVLQPNFRGSTGYGDQWFQKNGFQSWRIAIGDVDDGGRWLIKEGIAQPGKLAIVGWSYGGYAALQSAVTEPGLFKAVIAIAPVTDLDRWREERRYWSDYNVRSAFIGTGPHVADGSPARHADAIDVPVLMFHGTLDRNVGVGESQLMSERLRKAGGKSDLIIYKGLDHYLEDDAARTDMLTRSAAFLTKALNP